MRTARNVPFSARWREKAFMNRVLRQVGLCYFMCNERHVVLLRVSDEFQFCLKKSH